MADFKIFIETGTDLPKKYILSEKRLEVIPINLIVDGKEYRQDAAHPELLTPVFYEGQRRGKKGTAVAVHSRQIVEQISPVLAAGQDVLYLSLADNMGGNLGAAKTAAALLKSQYPEREVLVVDTACVSLGQGRLVELCNEYAAEHSLQETYEFALQKAPAIHHLFTVQDTKYLRRVHEIGPIKNLWKRTLGRKPVYELSAKGRLSRLASASGREQAINCIAEKTVSEHVGEKVYIAHADDLSGAGKLKAKLCKLDPKLKVEIGDIGPAMGLRCGAGTLAVFYEGEDR